MDAHECGDAYGDGRGCLIMARKGYSDEDVLRLLCEIELNLASGNAVATACRSSGASDAPYPAFPR